MKVKLLESATQKQNISYLTGFLGIPIEEAREMVVGHVKNYGPRRSINQHVSSEVSESYQIQKAREHGPAVIESFRKHRTYRKASKDTGLCHHTVKAICVFYDLPPSSACIQQRLKFRKACAWYCRQRGFTHKQIAERYGISEFSSKRECAEYAAQIKMQGASHAA